MFQHFKITNQLNSRLILEKFYFQAVVYVLVCVYLEGVVDKQADGPQLN